MQLASGLWCLLGDLVILHLENVRIIFPRNRFQDGTVMAEVFRVCLLD
jgi:hypothetical protein